MNKFLPILLIAGAAIAFLAFGRGRRQALAPSPRPRRRPRQAQPPVITPAAQQRPVAAAGCGPVLEPSERTEPCYTGTCPLRRAEAAELSTVGDLARWVDCASQAGSLSAEQVGKGIMAPDIDRLMRGDPAAWARVRADIAEALKQQGAQGMPGSASLQYLVGSEVRTVNLQRNFLGDLQLVYSGPLTTGWRQYPQFAAYGTAYWV